MENQTVSVPRTKAELMSRFYRLSYAAVRNLFRRHRSELALLEPDDLRSLAYVFMLEA